MDHELLERKYLSFKKGVEEALRKFTSDIGDNVRGMREEINEIKQDIKKNKRLECVKCKDKFTSRETFDQMKVKVDSLEEYCLSVQEDIENCKSTKYEDYKGEQLQSMKIDTMNEETIKHINEEIEVMKTDQKDNNDKIKSIDERINLLNTEQRQIRDNIEKNGNICEIQSDLEKQRYQKHRNILQCNMCENRFSMNHELEEHLLNAHKETKLFSCVQCNKNFVLKWRLTKHMREHQQLNIRKCHYFNNNKECPFSKIGCKFSHEIAPECKYGSLCERTKCQYRHCNQQ